MSDARERILARLGKRAQSADNLKCQRTAPFPEANKVQNTLNTQNKLNNKPNIEAFMQILNDNQFEVYKATHSNWQHQLQRIAKEKQLKNWVIGQHLSLLDQANEALSAIKPSQILKFDRPYEALKATLFNDVDASFTLARGAIYETGTLVVIPDKNEPRSLSLIPHVHVVLLRESDIVLTMEEALKQLLPEPLKTDTPSNILFISSPSKTADIQQTLAYGAHGPKEVIVILLEND